MLVNHITMLQVYEHELDLEINGDIEEVLLECEGVGGAADIGINVLTFADFWLTGIFSRRDDIETVSVSPGEVIKKNQRN